MERRTFLTIVGGAGFVAQPFPGLRLTAFAAEHLPHSAVLHGYAAAEPGTIFEMRRYEGSLPPAELLARHGIRAILENQTTMLVPFTDLANRDQAWSALASDPEWRAQRRNVTQISLYRAADSPAPDHSEVSAEALYREIRPPTDPPACDPPRH